MMITVFEKEAVEDGLAFIYSEVNCVVPPFHPQVIRWRLSESLRPVLQPNNLKLLSLSLCLRSNLMPCLEGGPGTATCNL